MRLFFFWTLLFVLFIKLKNKKKTFFDNYLVCSKRNECDFPPLSFCYAHWCSYLSLHLSFLKRKKKRKEKKVILWKRHRHLRFSHIVNLGKQTHWHENNGARWATCGSIRWQISGAHFSVWKCLISFLNGWYYRKFGNVFFVEENKIKTNNRQVFWKNQKLKPKLQFEMKIMKRNQIQLNNKNDLFF